MSSYDTALWTCPVCGHRVESKAVVDETFVARVQKHEAAHNGALDPSQNRQDGEIA